MARIIGFEKKSLAKRAGLKKGDEIISINSRPFKDMLDYVYFDSQEILDIDYISKRGKQKFIRIEKSEDETLGINFGKDMEITPMHCKNKCIFCFVDQLPKNMRDTLYVKDDDYRLSFISGNYITLTNLSDDDIQRIIDLKLSPIYISVHATNDKIRKSMVTNPNTLKLMGRIKRLTENGIIIHTQIVLCEGINDGDILLDSIKTLYKFYPSVRSLAIVPVGLTSHRDNLFPLKPLSNMCLNDTLDLVENFNKGKNFCWCSDEFYIKAKRDFSPYEYYANFPQIENGVGLIATYRQNICDGLQNAKPTDMKGKKFAFITGYSFYDELKFTLEKIEKYTKNFNYKIYKIKNNYFGDTITVSGLVVGKDILEQVDKGYDAYFIPKNMLKEFEDVFLDGVTLAQLKDELGKIKIIASLGEDFVKKVLGSNND